MAYLIGLWLTTGYIHNNQVFIVLSKKNKTIVEKIQIDKQVERRGNKIYLSLRDETIYSKIIQLKGKEFVDFSLIPDEYVQDFIRGYFDGCGRFVNISGDRLNVKFQDENQQRLIFFKDFLQKKNIIKRGSIKFNCFKLGTKDSILLGKYIYKNNSELFLKRKKEKFNNYVQEEK